MFLARDPRARARRRPYQNERLARATALEGGFQSAMAQLTGDIFLAGFALALGAGELLIGLLAALPLLARLSQLYTSSLVERAGRWRELALRGALVGRLSLLLAAAIPFVLPEGAGAWALIGAVALAAVGGSIFEMSFLSWMADLVPARARGDFFGRRNRVMAVAGLAVSLAAAFALDRWHAAYPGSLTGFALVFVVGASAGMIGLVFMRRIPAPPGPAGGEAPAPRHRLGEPVRDPNFRRLLLFAAAWGLAMGIASPFFAIYQLQELRLSFTLIVAFKATAVLAMALTSRSWGRLADHFGSKPVLRTGTYLYALMPILWMLSAPERIWPIALIQLIAGLAQGAYELNVNNLILKLAPARTRPSYIASFGAVASASAALAPILGGALLQALGTLGVDGALPFYLLFGLAALLRALASPLLGRVSEPDGASVGRMIRVMGRFRSMTTEVPFEPLFHYVYTQVARVADFVAREKEPADARIRHAAPSRPGHDRSGHRRPVVAQATGAGRSCSG